MNIDTPAVDWFHAAPRSRVVELGDIDELIARSARLIAESQQVRDQAWEIRTIAESVRGRVAFTGRLNEAAVRKSPRRGAVVRICAGCGR